MNFINIHTHSRNTIGQHGTIENVLDNFQCLEKGRNYSIGLHPWYLKKETADEQFEEMKNVAMQENVLAIGECGLDKICETDFGIQQKYFAMQIQLANETKKPLIIHCVKAFEEVAKLLNEENVIVPVIFHGFNKNEKLAAQLIRSGYYLSFGKHLLHENTIAAFKSVPDNKYLLETDDASLPIEDVYTAAAKAKNVDLKSIVEQVSKNAFDVFGKNLSE